MARFISSWGAFSVLILMSLGVRSSEAAPRASGALVFVSDREGSDSLYLVNADGSASLPRRSH